MGGFWPSASNNALMSLTRHAPLVLPVIVVALLALSYAPADAGPSLMVDAEEQQVECEGNELSGNGQLTGPEAYSTSHVLGGGHEISLDVLVVMDLVEGPSVARLRDGTPEGEAAYQAAGDELYAEVMDLLEPSTESYPDLGIVLNYAGWDLLAPLDENGNNRVRTVESQEIIDLTKEQYGGERPADVDIVYTVTDLDIEAIGTNAVAGQADCIGGVANPSNAFAVGEIRHELIPPEGLPIGPVTFYNHYFAKIAAHEIGHLLGAHHHYQECATPGPAMSAVEHGENGPCSLMTNAVDFQTLPFSTLNGVVVRGHAEAFVTP